MAQPSVPQLPDDELRLVAHALLVDNPQADSQALCRLFTSSKALQQRVRADGALMKKLQAAREMLTQQRLHELKKKAGKLDQTAALPFVPSNYLQFCVDQPPAPVTELNLDMCGTWRTTARGLAVARLLRVSGSLAYINLYNNIIGDAGAKALAAAVAASGSLAALDLNRNQIGDEGAKALAAAVAASGSLTSLDVRANKIGDEGAKALANAVAASGSLATLYLHHNKIGDEGAKALAAGVAASVSLEHLDISYNNIGDEGAKAIADAVADSGSLSTLGLGGNNIGAEGANALGEAFGASDTLAELCFLAPTASATRAPRRSARL